MSDFISDEEMAKLEQANTPDFIPDEEAPRDYEAEATLAADKKFEETKPSMLEAAKMGFMQGTLRNFGDEVAGLNGAGAKANVQSRVKRSQEEQPITYALSEIAAKLATLPGTVNPFAAAGVTAADTIASGIGDDKSAGRIAMETAGGATLAGLMTKFGPMLSSTGKDKLAKLLQNRADSQAIKALGGTQKQIQDLGGKASEVAQHARENILSPFASSKTLAERSTAYGDDIAKQMAPIYEQASNVSMSADDLQAVLANRAAQLQSKPGTVKVGKQVASYADDVATAKGIKGNQITKEFLEAGGNFDDAAVKAGKQSYNPADLREFRMSVDDGINYNSDAVSQLGAKDVRAVLRAKEMGLIEQVDPALREANEGLFKQYHLNSLAEDMADKGAARAMANNDIGLNTWQAMNVAADAGTGGVWTMVVGALREGGRRFGPQLQGIYLDKAAKAMQNPKLAKVLEDAAARGPEAVVSALAVIDKLEP